MVFLATVMFRFRAIIKYLCSQGQVGSSSAADYTTYSMKEYNLEFVGKTHLTSDIWRFEFKKPADLSFTAGQFMQYSLPHAQVDDRGAKRWFTISAAPTEPVITITTRIFEKMSSFKHALNSLPAGSSIYATGPDGDFVLPTDKKQPVVMIAGGIGVTPFHSQIKELVDKAESRPITLIYGAKTPADFVYNDVFAQAAKQSPSFHLVRVVGTPDAAWQEQTGQITDDMIRVAAPDIATTAIYVSGPEPMVDSFKPRLLKLGFSEISIHGDWFPGYTDHF